MLLSASLWGGRPDHPDETVLQFTATLHMAERAAATVGLANELNRSQGWLCGKCSEVIPHDLVIASLPFDHRLP